VQGQVCAVRKYDLVKRHLDGTQRREVGIQDGEGELLSGGSADLRDAPFHPSAQRENEVIEGVDRLHQMSLNRLADAFHADLAIERNLEWCSGRQRQSDSMLRGRITWWSAGGRIRRDLRVCFDGKRSEDTAGSGGLENAVKSVFEAAFTGARMHVRGPVLNLAKARSPSGGRAAYSAELFFFPDLSRSCGAERGYRSRKTINGGTA